MSVVIQYGIGWSEEAKAAIIDMSAARDMLPSMPKDMEQVIPEEKLKTLPWAPWGNNNLLPLEMLCDIKATPLLNAIIEGQTRLAVCEGIVPVITKIDATTGKKVIDKYLDDAEINDFLEMNDHFNTSFAWTKDRLAFNRSVKRIMLNGKMDKIVSFRRDDVVETRMAVKNKYGKIPYVYYSAEWNKARTKESEFYFAKPHLSEHNPYQDLVNRIKRGATDKEYSVTNTHPGWNEHYYPIPMWMAAIKWIKIVQSIPEMKKAMYENVIRAKVNVIIQESYWLRAFGAAWAKGTEKERADFRDKVFKSIEEYLVGAKNAGKAIFTNGFRDRDGNVWSDITFEEVKDSTQQGEYLPDSAAGNSEISFCMLWNNAMTGGNQKTNLYSENQGGSNVREASTLQVIISEVHRQNIRNHMSLIKWFNKWNVKHPGIDFIVPATILTTTDTGAGSKPVVPGGPKPKEDGADKNS